MELENWKFAAYLAEHVVCLCRRAAEHNKIDNTNLKKNKRGAIEKERAKTMKIESVLPLEDKVERNYY